LLQVATRAWSGSVATEPLQSNFAWKTVCKEKLSYIDFLLTAIAAKPFIKAFPLPNLFSGTG